MGFDVHANLFVEESLEILEKMEAPLMVLAENPEHQDLINEVFRALHTIKGSGSMFGFNDIAQFVHNLETAYDDIRQGNTRISREIIELTLTAKDRIHRMLLKNDNAEEKALREKILSRLAELTDHADQPAVAPVDTESVIAPDPVNGPSVRWRIHFEPSNDILLRGVRIVPLLDELRSLGDCRITTDIGNVPTISELNPEHLYFAWDAELITAHPLADIKSVFIFVEDFAKISIEKSDEPIAAPAVDTSVSQNTDKPAVKAKESSDALPVVERRKADVSSIRVKNEKLDTLVNLVGELVTLHARINQTAINAHDSEFVLIAEALGRLTDELRDNTMNIRMVPLSEVFSSFNRLVFDLSHKLDKKIKLVTTGGQTELDKNVIEELRDPLMHLIRNSADHAIESPEERRAKGKDETGTVRLSAEYSGSNVIIRINDDGTGLNREKIKALAAERGIISATESDDNIIYNSIFEPGFSTAKSTTDVSGRGVGMDVVKRNIEKLRGSIEVSTTPGEGTEVALTIPLTLAIIDGFMFGMGGNLYVFNLSAVRECVEYTRSEKTDIGDQFTINIRGDLIPCIDLLSLFGIPCTIWGYSKIIIVDHAGARYGFLVDRIIGKCQSVIKPLGRGATSTEMISGATILGDGSVALMLDISSIIKRMITHQN